MQIDVIASRNPNAIHDMLLQKIKTGKRSHKHRATVWLGLHHTAQSISDTTHCTRWATGIRFSTASSGGATSTWCSIADEDEDA